jgi:Protein of unknown function (DUF4199)
MKRTILIFGLISGVISSVMMVSTLPFIHKMSASQGLIVGYTSIVLSFMLVFFGIRSYRENVGNGEITFGTAFLVGIGITLISCVFYVATWEIIYFKFMPNFMDNYGSSTIEKLRAAGATAEVIQRKINEYNQLRENLKNPIYNSAMTFLEPFPVGLLITLISAGILRKKHKVPIAATA